MLDITEATTVKELLTVHPEVFEVLLGHGMCESCQASPPPVPLGHFAMKHCGGDFSGLLGEIRTTLQA